MTTKNIRKLQKLQARLDASSRDFDEIMTLPEGQHGMEFCRKCALITNLRLDETLQLAEADYIVNKYRLAIGEDAEHIFEYNNEDM